MPSNVIVREGGRSSRHRAELFAATPAATGWPAGACHRAGHFGPDPLAGHDRS